MLSTKIDVGGSAVRRRAWQGHSDIGIEIDFVAEL